ncbi:adenosine amp deaminase [Diplodia corticola]|uniref:adenosine deaminase n=1 Tax=Diplodia corticola TaxID=236234 RepID=A0A1J9QQ78_9PEZI|nr:adenosine amp deaminase [Diplodia corticola]OJD30609.1 adenosine amp deaminase [Diplodia corticola]
MPVARKSQDSPRKRTKHQELPATPPAEADEQPVEQMTEEEKLLQVGDQLKQNLNNSQQQEGYDQDRRDLLQQEQTESWDRKSKLSASEVENRAAHIVWKIREHERDNLFGNLATEAVPDASTRDMGGQFLTNKERIDRESKLFEIVKHMPKGAHLHAHFNAELPVDELLERAKGMDTMFVRSIVPLLAPEDFNKTEIVFTVLPANHPEADLFSEDYKPDFKNTTNNPWMKWTNFQRIFSDRNGGTDATAWVRTKMILSEEEVYGTSQTVNGIWARFNQATRCFKGLLNYESTYRWYVKRAMENMVENGIMYAELRPMLMDKTIPSDDGLRQIDLEGQMTIIREVIAKFREELDSSTAFEGIKIIYCTPRSIPKAKMQSELEDCIRLRIKFPDLICGFDLVGAEDRPNPIGFYRDELLSFVKTCDKLGIEIPFMFHAGETLLDTGGTKDPENSNLYESVLLKAKRVGHGFALPKHPRLIEKFKQQNICVEICPVSNELLHLCRNVKEHPYPEILAAGIPCTINADNPALFGADMNHEFYQVMVGTPVMSVHGWRQLIEWSIEYSCLEDEKKLHGFKFFREQPVALDFPQTSVFTVSTKSEEVVKLSGEERDVEGQPNHRHKVLGNGAYFASKGILNTDG